MTLAKSVKYTNPEYMKKKKKMGVIAAVKIKTYSVEIWNRFVIILNLLPHEFNTWWFPWKPVDIQLGTNNVPDI